MNPLCLTLAACLLSLGASPAYGQINPDNFTRSDLIKALEDNPFDRQPQRVTEHYYSPLWESSAMMDALRLIIKSPPLRRDAKVREKLETVSKTHPFADIRALANLLLSDYAVNTNILDAHRVFRAQRGNTRAMQKEMRVEMKYCGPPPGARRPDFELEAEQKAKAANRGRAIYRFNVPLQYGTLSGGYYTIQGVGLSYAPHAAPDKPAIGISSDNNRYVMPSNQDGVYWLIDGPHHMIGGGTITRLVETRKGIERYEHRILPNGVAQIFELPDGGVFISFANLDPSKRGGTWTDGKFTPTPLDFYNPPILLHPDGKISHACTQDAQRF